MLGKLLFTLTLVAGLASSATAEISATREGDTLVLRSGGQVTLRARPAPEARVEGDTVVLVSNHPLELELPGYTRGLALFRAKRYWTRPVFPPAPERLPGECTMLLWERSGYQVLLPTGVGALTAREGRLELAHATGLVYACGSDPYETLHRAARQALRGAAGKLREEKPFPKPFRYLGWCSWNAFYDQVDRDKVLAAVHSLPVRPGFVLIDDGWMTTAGRKLAAFPANPEKFPGGLGGLKEALGVPYLGVWHTLQGSWDGTVPDLSPGLMLGNEGLSFPDPRGTEFYTRWKGYFAREGVDFVKVDNQAGESRFTEGILPLEEAGAGSQKALQAAYGGSILNCMEMSLENVYNFSLSNLARSSDDYLPGQESARHVFENAYNAVWLSQFAYPDYDMFQSGRPDGAFHAVARAISGGPIYCTDPPGGSDAAVLRRLCYSDGRLLQPDAPGLVARSVLLVDPTVERVVLPLEAPVTRQGYAATLVGCFNVNASSVRGSVGRTGSVCYLWRQGRAVVGRASLELAPGQWEMAYVVPIEHQMALFGALDKYLGPVALQRVAWSDGSMTADIYQGERFGAWLERAPRAVLVNGAPVKFSYRAGLLEVPLPGKNCLVTLTP